VLGQTQKITSNLETFPFGSYQLVKNSSNQVLLIGKEDYYRLETNQRIEYTKPTDSIFKDLSLSYLKWAIIKDKIYLVNPSGGYVFEFDEQGVERIDNSSDLRAYYGNQVFSYNNELYQLGGYGFWEFKSQLLRFDFEIKEWVLEDTLLDSNLGFIDPIVAVVEDHLFILSPRLKNNFFGTTLPNKTIFKYNLKTKSLSEIDFEYEKYPSFFIQNKYIVKFFSDSNQVGLVNNTNEFEISLFDFEKNTIELINMDSPIDSETRFIYDQETFFSLSRIKENPKLNRVTQSKVIFRHEKNPINTYSIYYLLGLFLLILPTVVFLLKSRKSYVLDKRTLSKGFKKIKIDYDEFYFLEKLIKEGKVENQDLISYFDRDGKSYDLNVKRKNSMISRLSFKIISSFKTELFEKVPSPKDKRQGMYIAKKKLTLAKKKS